MRSRLGFAIAGLVCCTFVAGAVAQTTAVMQTAAMPPGVQQSLSNLADEPATHTGFTFDRSMMRMAQGLLQSGGLDEQRAAAAITSISFDTYRYPRPAFYTPETMAAIIAGYRAAGWKHLVDGNQSPANSAQPKSTLTDLWLHFTGADIDDLTVLIRSPRDMNLIQVSGDLRPLDLIHLSGHFGIPKVDPNAVMVPAPDGK
jgi:hypothetical protein